MVEVNCETDFVARNDDFQALVQDVACRSPRPPRCGAPRGGPRRAGPRSARSPWPRCRTKQPAAICEKIVEGKLDKFFQDVCLLDQPFVKDDKKR